VSNIVLLRPLIVLENEPQDNDRALAGINPEFMTSWTWMMANLCTSQENRKLE